MPYEFGDTKSLLSDRNLKLINILRNEHGYTDNNLRAAPYDWRLGPSTYIVHKARSILCNIKFLISQIYYFVACITCGTGKVLDMPLQIL